MKINYKVQDKFDFYLFAYMIALCIIGLAAIYSATYSNPSAHNSFTRQVVWLGLSLVVFFIAYSLPTKIFKLLAFPLYVITIAILIFVIFYGRKIYGAQSWLIIGPFGFQPSELAKFSTVLMLADWLGGKGEGKSQLQKTAVALIIGIVPFLLILLEPDLGTAIVFAVFTIAMIFWSGIDLFGLFVVLSPLIVVFASLFGWAVLALVMVFVVLALAYFKKDLFTSASVFILNLASGFFFDFFFKLLKPHQQKRILTFINPQSDPLGYGYNALQAKVAIGSGGLLGKGFLHGSQTQLRFIPEQRTDFIFAVIGEEFGFIGAMIVVVLFLLLFLRLLKLTLVSKDNFGGLFTIGVLSIFLVHFFINIGMNIGIAPVIGIPLPFISYGGSSLMANMFAVGVVMNLYRTRKERV